MMEKKQRRIDALEKQEHDQDTALDKLMAVANSKVKSAQEKANLEAKMKTEAFNKIVEMKTKKEMMMTLDEQFSIDYWKTKHDSLEKELQEMKDENLKILLMLSNQ
jgi:CHASE3 domain sensor protein